MTTRSADLNKCFCQALVIMRGQIKTWPENCRFRRALRSSSKHCAATQNVEGIVNLEALKKEIDFSNKDVYNDVLNGVTLHPAKNTLFITGKDWEKTFEIKLID